MAEILNNLQLDALLTQVVAWLPSLFAAILIFVAFWAAHRVSRGAVKRMLEAAGLDHALRGMLLSIYRAGIFVFAAVMAASQLGIDVGAALAGLGVVGLTIGFAAKDSLTNTIAGFLIFWDKPFEVNDWVTVTGEYGKVTNITMRTTRIRTLNNTYVVIPNQLMIDEVLVNHSKHGETRIVIPVGIAYKESIDDARKVMLKALSGVEGVLKDPAPRVVAANLGGSSVDLEVRVWIDDASQEKPIFFRSLEACKNALDEAGIEIPFPHLQLFMDGIKDEVLDKAAGKWPVLRGEVNGRRAEAQA